MKWWDGKSDAVKRLRRGRRPSGCRFARFLAQKMEKQWLSNPGITRKTTSELGR
jgi:hypothetical protein